LFSLSWGYGSSGKAPASKGKALNSTPSTAKKQISSGMYLGDNLIRSVAVIKFPRIEKKGC
jgi:hypothetical protein